MKRKLMITAVFVVMLGFFLQNTGVSYAEEDTAVKINEYVEENNPTDAAVAVSVVDREQTLYQENFGYYNKKEQIRADEQTIYEWGSLSKVLTWISVMQLYEQGQLDLEEDIRVYLPKNYLKKLKYDKPVTIQDLMNHTGGWQDSISNLYSTHSSEIVPLEEYVQKYEPAQIYEPGSAVAYSNWGTALAGLIVERVSGEKYDDYVANHIFYPLDMKETSIDPLREDNDFVKKGLEKVTGYDMAGNELSGHFYAPAYPAAGAAGTVRDVEKLMKALLGSSKYSLFEKKETLQSMLECTHTFAGNDEYPELAHGLWYDFYTKPALGHYGNTVQFSVHMSISPETGTGVLVMTNQAQEMKLNHGVAELIFGDGKPDLEIEQTEDTQSTNGKYQFKDFYTGARTIEKGYCKFYHFMNIYTAKYTGEDTILLSSLMMQVPCRKVNDCIYRAESGFVEGYYFFLDVDENGIVQKIATSTFDIIPYSTGKVIIDITTSVLAGLALLAAIISLVMCIVKMGKKNKGYVGLLLMNLLSIGYYVLVAMESIKLISQAATSTDILPFAIGYMIYMLIAVVNLILFFVKQKKNAVTIMTASASVCIMIYILYLQMFFM